MELKDVVNDPGKSDSGVVKVATPSRVARLDEGVGPSRGSTTAWVLKGIEGALSERDM